MSHSTTDSRLALIGLRKALSDKFEIPIDIALSALLLDDLGCDSITVLELVLFVEEEAGLEGPGTGEYPILKSVSDLEDYFLEVLKSTSSDSNQIET